jgi:PAS domain S-box-containing protein
MKKKIRESSGLADAGRPGREAELLRALNAAAASLQRSARSEAQVFRAASAQIAELGLRGGLSLLDDSCQHLIVRAFAYPGQMLARLERITGLRIEGFRFAVADVDAYRQVVETGQTVFVADSSTAITQLIPRAAQRFASLILRALGATPGIFAPLVSEGRVRGVLNVTGAGLTAEDTLAMEAFANHVSIALDNARLYAAAQQELAERSRTEKVQAATYRISQAALAAQDLEALFRSIHDIVGELMPAQNFYIALYDAATDMVSFPFFIDERDEWSPPHKAGRGLTEYVLRTGEPLLASPAVFAELVRAGEAELVGVNSIDWLGVPLKTADQTIGVLVVQTYTEGVRYALEDRDILTFVSSQVAMAIARKRAEEALSRRARELAALYETSLEINAQPDVPALLRTIVRRASELVGVRMGGLYLMHPDQTLELVVNHSLPDDSIGTRLRLGEGLSGRVAQSGEWMMIDDYSRWEGRAAAFAEAPFHRVLGVPLKVKERVIGVIDVTDDAQTGPFSQEDIRLVRLFADQAAIAVENARLYQQAQQEIAERRRVEEALRASEERFRALIENSSDMISLLNSDGVIVYASPSVTRVLGYALDEYVGRDGFDLLHPDDRDSVAAQFADILGRAGQAFRAQYRFRHRDGSWRWIEGVGSNMLAEPSVRAIVVNARDVTERVEAEESLRQAQKMESLGILAGGVAHDFNNLLVALLGQTSLALAQLPLESPARTHVEKAVKAAERAADLTRQMLAYSGRGQFEMRFVNLNTLIRENLHLFEVAVPKNVQLRSELAEALPLIEADVGQMQQVVMNLIINAAEAIGERPGAVVVSTDAIEVSAGDDRLWRFTGEPPTPGRYVMLEVRDNGSGMDAETLSRIFDPFFTTKFTGRGLGLAAVLGIVRGHKAGLQVTSEPGQGTAFRLAFPALDGPQQGRLKDEDKTERGAFSPHPPPVILVIDDEEPVREAVTDILEMEGLQVLSAANGAAGIDLYRERRADVRLVLLDLSMPGMNGEQAFHELRRIDPSAHVILSSGYSQLEATQRFVGLGLAGFIQKPYDAATLIEAIRRHLY